MKRIFVSFLGMGPEREGYSELNYKMEGKPESISTEFVQRAEIDSRSHRFTTTNVPGIGSRHPLKLRR